MNATKYAAADQAIAAYDAFIFASVGRAFNSLTADLLAESAADACKIAARDRSINATTRKFYREHATEFAAIYA